MARSVFLAMGLRIGYWRRLVEQAWSAQSRDQYIESALKTVMPLDADGNVVTTLTELQAAPILKKKTFRQSASKPAKVTLFHRHTAGSSGDPTEVWLDRRELGRMLGVRDYCYRYCGIRVGDKEGRLWGRPDRGFKSRLKNFLLNRRIFNTSGQKLESEVRGLIEWQPAYLYGYASLLMECARQLIHTEQSIPGLQCVIVTAETVLPSQKEYLSRVFNCQVYEEYGASEFDIIAFECRRGHRHLVNPWLLVESGPEEQALVTDVCRKSQSLVRYELGDTLQLSKLSCSEIGSPKAISILEGRSSNRFVFTEDKNRFHAVEIAYAVNEYQIENGELFQFNLIQSSPGLVRLFCNPEPRNGAEDLANYIQIIIRDKTGYNVCIMTCNDERQLSSKKPYFEQKIQDDEMIKFI